MPLVPAKCPECGGLVEVDNEKRAGLCQHCGEAFVVEDAIQTFNTYYQTINNYNTTHNYGDGTIVNVYEDKNKDFVIEAGVLKEYHGESANVVIPNNVTVIGQECFMDMNITSIVIPNSVTEIQKAAFKNCKSLTEIVIPDSVIKIVSYYCNEEAFNNCKSLKSITIGKALASLSVFTPFNGCDSLEKLNFSSSMSEFKNVFSDFSINNIFVDKGNENFCSVDGVLFNKNMTELILYPKGKTRDFYSVPKSVTKIRKGAFEDCNKLEKIILPENLTDIGDYAFRNCINLKNIKIPSGVKHIHSETFKDCLKLTETNIIKLDTTIDDNELPIHIKRQSVKKSETTNIDFGNINKSLCKKEIITDGKTVEKAVLTAKKLLNVYEDDKLEIEILQSPKTGLLGFFGSCDAKVKVRLK